eukprot:GHVR01148785.1.p1 GENE.GHVR01148785.1~~GHVR01148785.1.p1  ORF type:complete len:390 (+),score=89.49 GHVR01148785.1:68-1237(+)
MGQCVSKKNKSINEIRSKCSDDDDVVGIAGRRRRLSVSQCELPNHDNDNDDNDNDRGCTFIGGDYVAQKNILNMFIGSTRKLSIAGVPPRSIQRGFDQKHTEKEGSAESVSEGTQGLGYVCRKGLKPESPNQDDFFILKVDDWGLYGVFDGHGPSGQDVSRYAQLQLPRMIATHDEFINKPEVAMAHSFIKCQNQIELSGIDCTLSGTTATVVLHRHGPISKLYIAHVGDSTCVIASKDTNMTDSLTATRLTHDHKPNSPRERARITKSGGQVKLLQHDIPYRVFIKGKSFPGLAMSRALGDIAGHQCGVVSTPDTSEVELKECDQFMLICSDGVWEFISPQAAVDLVSAFPVKKAQKAAEALAQEAWLQWIKEEVNVVDDITVLLIYL